MTRERLIFIDYCKAIAIVLVFLGHSKSAMSPFLKVILQFVMGGVFAYLLNRFTPVLIGKKKS